MSILLFNLQVLLYVIYENILKNSAYSENIIHQFMQCDKKFLLHMHFSADRLNDYTL